MFLVTSVVGALFTILLVPSVESSFSVPEEKPTNKTCNYLGRSDNTNCSMGVPKLYSAPNCGFCSEAVDPNELIEVSGVSLVQCVSFCTTKNCFKAAYFTAGGRCFVGGECLLDYRGQMTSILFEASSEERSGEEPIPLGYEENIALYKEVTASPEIDYDHMPTQIVDGSTRHGNHTNFYQQQYIEGQLASFYIDLGDTYLIHKIRLLWFTYFCCTENIKNTKIFLTETKPTLGETDPDHHMIRHYTQWSPYYANDGNWINETVSPPMCARYFYMMFVEEPTNTNNLFYVHEVEIYSEYYGRLYTDYGTAGMMSHPDHIIYLN